MTDGSNFDGLFAVGDAPASERLDDGGGYLLEVVSAVSFLRRGDRHGLTVWNAIEEALRWWTAEAVSTIAGVADPDSADLRWGDPDPLKGTLASFLMAAETTSIDADIAFQQSIRRWAAAMAGLYNDGQPWAPPLDPRGFPPPTIPSPLP
jgi:hypothetical protein